MQNNNHNTYSNNSPYSNANSDISQQIQEQRRLEDERKKQMYKSQCEDALNNIVHEFHSAQDNKLDNWKLNIGDGATVVRYYKRYWDNKFISWSLLALITTFILSFYTQYAVVGILVVFIFREMYAQRVFLTYLLNDHELTREQITNIKDKIFYKQLKTTRALAFTSALIIISYTTYIYSMPIFLEPEKYQKIIVILSKISPFYVNNELFAYTNTGAIILLLLLKTYEKWSK